MGTKTKNFVNHLSTLKKHLVFRLIFYNFLIFINLLYLCQKIINNMFW